MPGRVLFIGGPRDHEQEFVESMRPYYHVMETVDPWSARAIERLYVLYRGSGGAAFDGIYLYVGPPYGPSSIHSTPEAQGTAATPGG